MIVVVDYGMGNVRSIYNMLKKIGIRPELSGDPEVIEAAAKIILPGVGAFDKGMRHLRERGLVELLNDKILRRRTPVLGICLGMQLMARRSEEGERPGLGWLAADVRRFDFASRPDPLRVPQMGWNTVEVRRRFPLFENAPEEPRYYFAHSYHVCCDHAEDVAAETDYGGLFTSAVMHDNIMGTQFHPEKSHTFGMKLLGDFTTLI